MPVKTNRFNNPSDLDRKAASVATRIAERHGLRDRARNTFLAMANELLEDLQPAIEAQAQAAATQAAKARMREIMALPEARERRDMAQQLAIDTDSDAQSIKAILAATPKAATGPSQLDQLMKSRSPGISSDDGSPDGPLSEDDEIERAAQSILHAGEPNGHR